MAIVATLALGGAANSAPDPRNDIGRLATSSTQANISVNPQKEVTIYHEGVTLAGAADTNNIWLAVENPGAQTLTVDTSGAGGTNQYLLKPNESVVIPPGAGFIGFKTAAGTPAVALMCSENLRGFW